MGIANQNQYFAVAVQPAFERIEECFVCCGLEAHRTYLERNFSANSRESEKYVPVRMFPMRVEIGPTEGLESPMSFSMIRHKRLLEGVIVFGSTACAYAFSVVFGLTAMWEDALVYTVLVFATVIAVLRPAWKHGAFWKGLAVMFTGHTVILLLLLKELSPRRFGLVEFVVAGCVEAVFIGGMLWKEMLVPKSS